MTRGAGSTSLGKKGRGKRFDRRKRGNKKDERKKLKQQRWKDSCFYPMRSDSMELFHCFCVHVCFRHRDRAMIVAAYEMILIFSKHCYYNTACILIPALFNQSTTQTRTQTQTDTHGLLTKHLNSWDDDCKIDERLKCHTFLLFRRMEKSILSLFCCIF